ncbi:tyrosine-type recombinase/integrase [Pararhizobium sp. YC-54]|uniref:tyrosine-type recombinase/integrase n=1 Tax=Pararhizobium sp. YC-54 TaxID=2986920 RepID=UPI0021F6BB41|nr:site-specific integrase [Pararhizobium sp. YC-54]MCV9997666.1 tyrosine-type recombinase/integrase [Pararhizobium sp. YC-54]
MPRNKLTATQIKAATKPGRLGDGDGLYLVIRKDGRKSWSFLYIRNGVRREMGLGAFGSGTGQVSLADARVKAEEIRTILGRSGDPFAETEERKAKKQAHTFQQAVTAFLKSLEGKWKNEKHRAQWEMTLGEAYSKRLLKMNVAAITTDDVVAVLEPHWKEKNETASRLRGRIERVLDYARVAGWRSGENPAKWKGHLEHLLAKPDEKMKRGNHAAIDFAEMPAFMIELGTLGGISARALEFLILTAARTSEVLLATWDEIDLTNAVWTVPAERMKAGREHRVPLTKQAMQILTAMQSTRLNDFVFPGMKKDSPLSNMSMQKCLRALEKDQVATVHGFRSAFRDWAGDRTTFQREVMEAALAHSVGDKAEQAYRRSDALEKRRKLMDAWANYISSTQNSKVIPLTVRK